MSNLGVIVPMFGDFCKKAFIKNGVKKGEIYTKFLNFTATFRHSVVGSMGVPEE